MVEAQFYGLPFLTEPGRVFTPRATTELLVARALALEPLLAADVGTGSGAIAVSVAVHAPDAEVWAGDTCATAVRLARLNAGRNGVAGRVRVEQRDLLDGAPDGLDLVLANLPYLPERGTVEEHASEPPGAVYAPGDGLANYRLLLDRAQAKLRPGGRVLIQLRGEILEAGPNELHLLRQRLESSAWVAS